MKLKFQWFLYPFSRFPICSVMPDDANCVWDSTHRVFPFWNYTLNLLNLLNYFATSICTCVIQVVISTGILIFCTQVSISKLIQVQNWYLYFSKKKTHIKNNLKNLAQTKNGKNRLFPALSLQSVQLQISEYFLQLLSSLLYKICADTC